MNKHLYSLLSLFVGCVLWSSCTDNDYMELNKGDDQLTLTADNAQVVLEEQSHASDALALTWSTGTNHGTGQRISYTLEIAESGSGFTGAYTAFSHSQQIYSWSKSVEALNELLRHQFGAQGGETLSLEARITASVDGQSVDQTATTSFSVTTYEPVTSTLYLIGDATPNGWSADNATEMTRTDNGIFTWTGMLRKGNFKLITTLGQFLPSYNKGSNGLLTLRTSDDQPDEQYQVTDEHYYKVDVNLFTGMMKMSQTDGMKPAYDQLYLVGNMTGWNFEAMQRDLLDPYLFRMGRFFDVGGEFKFGTANGSWENMYKAATANASYTHTAMEFVKGYDPDNKWVLQDNEIGKAYKICVDIRTGKERMLMTEFTPYEMIFMVGDATPTGWDISHAEPMEKTDSPYIFTWTGRLNAGELKFTCDRQSDWNGAWFLASKSDMTPTGDVERLLFIDKSDDAFKAQYLDNAIGDIDQKWRVKDAGNYTITLNQLEETITIVKQ